MAKDTEPYSAREIELMFKNISDKLDGIRTSVDVKYGDTDTRIKAIEGDIEKFKTFKTQTMTVWSIGVTVAGLVLNKLFS